MALENTTFITVADVKTHLDISETTWDTVIENLINYCTRFAMNYCGGRRFIAPLTDETEYYDGGSKIFLLNYPVKSITSISYRSGAANSPTWTDIDSTNGYMVDDKRGIVHILCPVSGALAYKVVYKGGYDTAVNVPADLKMAMLLSVTTEFNRRKSLGMTSENVGGASVNWNVERDKTLLAILDNYRTFI